MEPQDHFNHCVRSILLQNIQMLLQLDGRNVKLDVDKFMDSFSATIDGEDDCHPDPWNYAPQTIAIAPPVRTEDGQIQSPTDLFPFRAAMMQEFLEKAHFPHAQHVPDIVVKGLLADFPDKLGMHSANPIAVPASK